MFGQKGNCNREILSLEYQRFIPKEVCIPNEYLIYYINSREEPIDFNQDGLDDFICSVIKKNEKIGDTSFLIFYKRNADSTFTFFKQFDNILPIRFEQDNYNPYLQDEKLKKIFDCYGTPSPLYSLDIKSDSIIIVQDIGAVEEKILYVFKFDSFLNDWKLIKHAYLLNWKEEKIEIRKEILLSQFSYCEEGSDN